MATTALYEYNSLDADQFRLLHVPVQLDLPYSLIRADIYAAPPYAALSYTWGNPNFSKHIIIDDRILEGLYALRERVSQSGSYFWVDAICIDQRNIIERNAQVLLMKSIYESAKTVYVWLGRAAEQSDLAMKKIGEYGRYLGGLQEQHENDVYKAVGTLSPDDAIIFGEEGSESFRSWNAIAILFRREWWFRVWVIQEATATATVFCCGTSTVSWKAIMFTVLIADQLSSFPGLESFSSIGSFWRKSIDLSISRQNRNASRPLLDVMQSFRLSECSDHRDRIYAKLGLATDITPGDIPVRYDKSICDVYADLVNWSFSQGSPFHQLDFLGLVIRSAEKPSRIQVPEDKLMPTWVPDWRGVVSVTPFCKTLQPTTGEYLRTYNVSGHSTAQARIVNQNFIAKGFTFAPIVSLSSISEELLRPVEVESVEATWAPINADDIYHSTGQTVQEAYLHTLTADVENSDQAAESRGHYMDWSLEAKQREALTSGADIEQEDLYTWVNLSASMRKATFGRRLMWTDKGYMGLAPAAARVADVVCVLLGGSVPYVLRAVGEHEHAFVGECYVHGIMDGEAMPQNENMESFRDFVLC